MGQEGFTLWNCRFIFSELSYSSERSPPLMQKEGSNPADSWTACFPSRKHSNSIEEANLEKPFRHSEELGYLPWQFLKHYWKFWSHVLFNPPSKTQNSASALMRKETGIVICWKWHSEWLCRNVNWCSLLLEAQLLSLLCPWDAGRPVLFFCKKHHHTPPSTRLALLSCSGWMSTASRRQDSRWT